MGEERGRGGKAKSFSLLLAWRTGSEVLSTEEVRSKPPSHPPISPQPGVERKAPASGACRLTAGEVEGDAMRVGEEE